MDDLEQFAERLRAACPGLTIKVSATGNLSIRGVLGRKGFVKLAKERIGRIKKSERDRLRRERRSFLDLSSGSLYLDEEGLYLMIRLPKAKAIQLSPYQCALLGAILTNGGSTWFTEGLKGAQTRLTRRVRLEFGITVQPMAMSRFIDALRRKKIIETGSRPTWDAGKALETLREDFRASSLGNEAFYPGRPSEVEATLRAELGGRFSPGVAAALNATTGAWIEPRDYLVDRGALDLVPSLLGPELAEVPSSDRTRGTRERPFVVIRSTLRTPLRLLTAGGETLQPILALCVAEQAASPVARQVAQEALRKWVES